MKLINKNIESAFLQIEGGSQSAPPKAAAKLTRTAEGSRSESTNPCTEQSLSLSKGVEVRNKKH